MTAERADDMQEISKVVPGDDAVRISGSAIDGEPSSGNPRIAERRLRRNVLRVGRSNEYTKVELDAFHIDVGPLVAQS